MLESWVCPVCGRENWAYNLSCAWYDDHPKQPAPLAESVRHVSVNDGTLDDLIYQDACGVCGLCRTCHGQPCPECGGSGVVAEQHFAWATEYLGCLNCHDEPCPTCGVKS